MTTLCDLAIKKCKPCEGGVQPLSQDEINALLKQLDSWVQRDQTIGKIFEFKNYYQTMAFVNAVAWIAHREDHHPDLNVSYNKCHVEFSTHAIQGLSENDFICAAKVDACFKA
ncbi:4a-hydroxytetrahydrobiopterin dehydratase [Candidatus Nitrotoga sp. M5]|uniref:4a-hydroxytetrahydrobiopterin dehydratase n=1 Tax=Candidatus Nitrotoga sp. M5 TaxID=2890409 RepID=UPI001EF2DA4B|nr:4a-hydroxytetrahydrobiopterin dehydratase [Candidatus Nitrotoga sp. M5]CAH1386321.1 putative pterin-4-alpha-carbinolamine dehydratase [Candidatus Nitrotoga sp. M5]